MANRGTRIDLSEVFAGLEKLGEAREPIARAMGLAMGVEVRDEAKVRAPVLQPGGEGYDPSRPGQLRDAMFVAYDERRNVLNPAAYRYTVSWNAKKAPHGHLMEFGFDMIYKVARGATGLWYTPLSEAKGPKGRNAGYLRDDGPLFVTGNAFLGPAFDAKQPRLASIAFTAGSVKFKEIM